MSNLNKNIFFFTFNLINTRPKSRELLSKIVVWQEERGRKESIPRMSRLEISVDPRTKMIAAKEAFSQKFHKAMVLVGKKLSEWNTKRIGMVCHREYGREGPGHEGLVRNLIHQNICYSDHSERLAKFHL